MLVSIVIPCHGQARYLPEAVHSVIAQTWRRWECIIVDDGSPDDTATVAQALIHRYPRRRIRLLRQRNLGVHAARNRGIRAARGALVLPLDADDRLEPRFLSAGCARFGAAPSLDLVYTDLRCFGARREQATYPEWEHLELTRRNDLPVATLHRRDLWERAGGYQAHALGYEDWDYWLACLAAGARGARVPEPLFHYRVRRDGALARARGQRDAFLKARIISARGPLFSTTQRLWAISILWHVDQHRGCPPAAGKSFAAAGEMPTDGQALADLGSMAYWEGDVDEALRAWLGALRGPDLTNAGRAAVLRLVRELDLEADLRRRAQVEAA